MQVQWLLNILFYASYFCADPDLLEVALTKSKANLLGTALTNGVRGDLLRTALTEARPDTLEAALTKADPELLKVALTESVPELLATALKVGIKKIKTYSPLWKISVCFQPRNLLYNSKCLSVDHSIIKTPKVSSPFIFFVN